MSMKNIDQAKLNTYLSTNARNELSNGQIIYVSTPKQLHA